MATKKFIIEVEEGCVPSCEICPFAVNGMLCESYGINDDGLLNCNKYNLATMKIKELEEIQCSET